MLLSEAFESYRRDIIIMKNQSPKTEEAYRYAMRSVQRVLGDIDVTLLNFDNIRKWRETSLKKCGMVTIRGYVVNLRCVLSYLRFRGIDVIDPNLIVIPKREQKIPKVVTEDKVELLIQSCNTRGMSAERRARNKLIFSLIYASGIRVSELVQLNRDDLTDGRFTVIGKGSKSRLCFYDERTVRYLKEYLALRKDGLPALLLSYGKPSSRMSPGDVREVFRNAGRRTGIEGLHPHTLRHTFASNLMQNGLPIYSLSRLLGHSSIETTAIYLHVSNPRLEEEYNRFHTIETIPVR